MARPQPARPTVVGAEPRSGDIIEVRAVRPPFVDQVEAVTIGEKFQPVKWHPWLQAQIDAGWLVKK